MYLLFVVLMPNLNVVPVLKGWYNNGFGVFELDLFVNIKQIPYSNSKNKKSKC